MALEISMGDDSLFGLDAADMHSLPCSHLKIWRHEADALLEKLYDARSDRVPEVAIIATYGTPFDAPTGEAIREVERIRRAIVVAERKRCPTRSAEKRGKPYRSKQARTLRYLGYSELASRQPGQRQLGIGNLEASYALQRRANKGQRGRFLAVDDIPLAWELEYRCRSCGHGARTRFEAESHRRRSHRGKGAIRVERAGELRGQVILHIS